jgi:hypothetical protein
LALGNGDGREILTYSSRPASQTIPASAARHLSARNGNAMLFGSLKIAQCHISIDQKYMIDNSKTILTMGV